MAPIPQLFSIPIGATGGSVVCTQPSPAVYLLTFTSPPDNRLVPDFNGAILLALDIIDYKLPRGVVVTTSGIPKFYSNGLDFEAVMGAKAFFEESLYPLWRRLLTYPMPTIALLPGHAFAGGLMTAVAHDYRVMNPSKGYLCLNEVEFGAPLRPAMAGLFRSKFSSGLYRTLALEGTRVPCKEAVEAGLVDAAGGPEEVLQLIKSKKLTEKAKGGVYGQLKEEYHRDLIRLLDLNLADEEKDIEARFGKTTRLEDDQKLRVRTWEANGGKIANQDASKL